MYWCSSAESEKLVKSIEDALEKINRAGPNPLKKMNAQKNDKVKNTLTTPVE